jgi:hypothetical protein
VTRLEAVEAGRAGVCGCCLSDDAAGENAGKLHDAFVAKVTELRDYFEYDPDERTVLEDLLKWLGAMP